MKKFQILFSKIYNRIYLWLSSLVDFIVFSSRIRKKHFKNERDNKIIFLGEGLAARIPRMSKYIKEQAPNYQLILICYHRTINAKFNTENFDRVIGFRNSWHLRSILSGLDQQTVEVVHSFGPKCLYPAVAIDFLNNKGIKVFYDLQDVEASNFRFDPPFKYQKEDLPHEKYCFEHADGIVAHSLEPLNAREVYQIKYKRVLFFPNYLDRIIPINVKKLDGLHLVYLGGVAGSDKPARFFGCMHFFWLIRELSKQKIHFHIYRTPSKNFDFSEYYKEDKQNPYFHFHEPVPQSSVSKEISKYHYGVLPFFNEDDGREPMKRKRSTSQKTFNYIEAGLPILVSEDLRYQGWISGKMGYSIIMSKKDFGNLGKKLENIEYSEILETLDKHRKKYHLKDKIHTLLDFYN